MINRKLKENIFKTLIILAGAISLGLLLIIVGFIFINGMSLVDIDYLLTDNNSSTQYVTVGQTGSLFEKPNDIEEGSFFLENYGITLKMAEDEEGFEITHISKDSPVLYGVNNSNKEVEIKEKDVIKKIDSDDWDEITIEEAAEMINSSNRVKLKITTLGGGIYPMLVTTLILIGLSLLIAVPIGVFASIYLVEYAKEGKFVKIIRFATESLAGIPSIVYGLFGMIFFVKFLDFGQSMISGSLTLSIILLPTIIRTTEETLKTVPPSYKEGSFALGANKLQTLWKVIMPNTISGILVAVLLSIGRIVGESAALLFTAGTFAKIPESIFDQGATLTVRAYMEVKEYGNVEAACAMGIVLLVVVFMLNILAKLITFKLEKGKK